MQQRLSSGQRHIAQIRLVPVNLSQLFLPVFFCMGIALEVFLIRIEAEKAIPVAHE